jgi:small subunit ribosomal protein S16
VGRKKRPVYRIVVTERSAAPSRFIETIGHYDPRTDPQSITVDAEKARAWLGKGATPSETVRSLFKKAGVFKDDAAAAPASAE